MTTASGISMSFGYWPASETVTAGYISITPLPDFDETIAAMKTQDGVDGDWIYAPTQEVRDFLSGQIISRPYSARIFGLPATHSITHAAPDSEDQVEFHVWGLSLFTGMRLTATEAGFVDATPVKPGKLVDFVLLGGLSQAVDLVERFWTANRTVPQRASLVEAAIHALFLAQGPQLLQYERFIFFYTALDACYALAADLNPPTRKPTHAARLAWMYDLFGMPTPAWATPAPKGSSPIAAIRNATMHEALYMGKPLGFALLGIGTGENLPLEMEGLVCRFLVALLGAPTSDYVKTRVNTRQRQGLRLS